MLIPLLSLCWVISTIIMFCLHWINCAWLVGQIIPDNNFLEFVKWMQWTNVWALTFMNPDEAEEEELASSHNSLMIGNIKSLKMYCNSMFQFLFSLIHITDDSARNVGGLWIGFIYMHLFTHTWLQLSNNLYLSLYKQTCMHTLAHIHAQAILFWLS